jgi:hypothetical protein
VRAYYRALDARRFDDAWKTLSPAVQAKLGPFARWKAGYGGTLSSRPRDFAVSRSGSAVTVEHVLVARDKGCPGERRFAVRWRLRATGTTWNVTGLTAARLGGPKCG